MQIYDFVGFVIFLLESTFFCSSVQFYWKNGANYVYLLRECISPGRHIAQVNQFFTVTH